MMDTKDGVPNALDSQTFFENISVQDYAYGTTIENGMLEFFIMAIIVFALEKGTMLMDFFDEFAIEITVIRMLEL